MKNFLKKSAAGIYAFIFFPVLCVTGLYGVLLLAEMLCRAI